MFEKIIEQVYSYRFPMSNSIKTIIAMYLGDIFINKLFNHRHKSKTQNRKNKYRTCDPND